MAKRKKNPNCGGCGKPKEEGREKQFYCRQCASEQMKLYRKQKVSISISLIESLLNYLPENLKSKLQRIINNKKNTPNEITEQANPISD